MPQCKTPLDWAKPSINICVLEEHHEGSHYTYGLGWNRIEFSSPVQKTLRVDRKIMTKIFETYVLRNGSLILAAQLTEENIEEMFKICRGIHPEYVARSESDEKLMESFEIDLGANTLWCELGDYIVSDMAGSHRPVPSEIFEAHIQGKMV